MGMVLTFQKLLYCQPLVSSANSATPGADHHQRLEIFDPAKCPVGHGDDYRSYRQGQR